MSIHMIQKTIFATILFCSHICSMENDKQIIGTTDHQNSKQEHHKTQNNNLNSLSIRRKSKNNNYQPCIGRELSDFAEKDLPQNNITSTYEDSAKASAVDSFPENASLTLKNCKNTLTTIINQLTPISNITELVLSKNQLKNLPNEISLLCNLTKLNLSDNQLAKVPSVLTALTNLVRLSLSKNKIKKLQTIDAMTKLQELYVAQNNINTVKLSLSFSPSIPPKITQLSNLKILDLSGNKLTEFPQYFSTFDKLQGLNLASNKSQVIDTESGKELTINQIPLWISCLTALTRLNLDGSSITELPDQITWLTNLTELIIGTDTIVENIPQKISLLTNLSAISIRIKDHRERGAFIDHNGNIQPLSSLLKALQKAKNKNDYCITT